MTEAKTNMAFGQFRRGERFQVDPNDTYVQGLIKGGYVTLIEEAHDGPLGDPADPDWSGDIFDVDLDPGAAQEEEALDGPREPEPTESDRHST